MPTVDQVGGPLVSQWNQEKNHFITAKNNAQEHAKTYLDVLKAVPEKRAHQYQSRHTLAQSSRANLVHDIRTMRDSLWRLRELASECNNKDVYFSNVGLDLGLDRVSDVDKFVDWFDEPLPDPGSGSMY